jgi:integrase/recombinase XerD
MTRRRAPDLATLLESFFRQHLPRVRGASPHTHRAYRDALRLFLLFLADHLGRAVDALSLDDLRVEHVLDFLQHLETRRGNTVSTRNNRLTALRSFVAYAVRHDPTRAAQYHQVLALPAKHAPTHPATYLEPDEAAILIAAPDTTTRLGARDHALLLFLYNTGARVSEALAVRRADLQLAVRPEVRFHGKGGKDRLCPLWSETAAALTRLLAGGIDDGGPVFRNARGAPLSRDGVAHIIDKYVKRATEQRPSLRRRRVTPHVLRHSCAVGLLQAAADLTVIRDHLGHTSVATTNRYVTTNLAMRRDVLEDFWRRSGLTPANPAPWRPRPSILAVLEAL